MKKSTDVLYVGLLIGQELDIKLPYIFQTGFTLHELILSCVPTSCHNVDMRLLYQVLHILPM